ncbi:MAG: toll/interleukin-1 receptor domain-containing protein [Myxococcota bacterium]
MARVAFISYRRSDTLGHAYHFHSRLAARFGEERVFLDKQIRPGSDYTVALRSALGHASVVVALIGSGWLDCVSAAGTRRLDAPDDWVREELATALAGGVTVIPVLLEGAVPPESSKLPEDLRGLALHQALRIPNDYLDEGLARLATLIADLLRDETGPGPSAQIEADLARVRQIRDGMQHTPGWERAGKLAEVQQTLEGVLAQEPNNTEALLLLAEALTVITPDDPSDEAALVARVRELLKHPKDDAERFQLAKATLFASTMGHIPDLAGVRAARDGFLALERRDWVQQCDAILARTAQPTGPPPFVPVGRWRIQDSAAFATTATWDLFPNGAFQGHQQTPSMGLAGPSSGRWAWDPNHRLLHFQGAFNGFVPIAMTLSIQGATPQGFYGVGNDGNSYTLERLG